MEVKKVYLGAAEVTKIYIGDTITYITPEPDNTAPVTSVYPDPTLTYEAGAKFWLEVNEASITYYTLDGSTPTENSTVFREAITLNETTDLKYFSVDEAGNKEAVKTTRINIAPSYRYIRFIGYGDHTSEATTRLVELKASDKAGVNSLLNKLPISGETPNAGAGIEAVTDGIITHASGSYPIWWSGAGIPTLVYDIGAQVQLSTLNVVMYSTVNDPRQTKFIVAASKDNAAWTTIANYSTNVTAQPEAGFTFDIV